MFIAISGIDGAGKTVQVQLLRKELIRRGHTVEIIKAYDDDVKLLCKPLIDRFSDPMAIMFLFQALHAQQFRNAVEALERGTTVIADRWDESYLGYHTNFGILANQEDTRNMLNEVAFRGLVPDIGITLKLPVQTARLRREGRGFAGEFDAPSDDHFHRLQSTYVSIATQRGWTVLDGSGSRLEVRRRIMEVVEPMLAPSQK
ncbi:MAG: dTMP kinase [Patescibacteria group bacterium]